MLPINDLPYYQKEIPSSGKIINFRPFTVKEQRILLFASQSGEESQMVTAIKQIIELCVKEKIDVEELALFDIEYLFLNIAAKSTGEIVELVIKCKHCDKGNDYDVNLLDIKLEMPPKDSNIIRLSDKLGIVFKYPNMNILSTLENSSNNFDKMMDVLATCVDYIYDLESVYYAKDTTPQKLKDFLDSLSIEQIQKIEKWFTNIPEVQDVAKFTCIHCGTENEYIIKGIKSFL